MGGNPQVLSWFGAPKYVLRASDAPPNAVDYFTKVLEDDLKAVVKPQYVDQIPKAVKQADRSVATLLKARASDHMNNYERMLDVLGMA